MQSVREEYAKGNTTLRAIAESRKMSITTIASYVQMTDDDVGRLAEPRPRSRTEAQTAWEAQYANIAYKMMADGHDDRTIYSYLRAHGIDDPASRLCSRLYAISLNNFPERRRMHTPTIMGGAPKSIPVNAVRVSSRELVVAVCTLDEGRKNKEVEKYFPEICARYPIVGRARRWLTFVTC